MADQSLVLRVCRPATAANTTAAAISKLSPLANITIDQNNAS
jgi:hypothetical protein